MNSSIFYVYEHWRPDTGRCFYVGKGKNGRAHDFVRMRNRHYLFVVAKLTSLGLTVDVRFIERELSEERAIALEMERIAYHGVDNLTNLTLGGDGLRHPSEALRERISEAQKRRFACPEERARHSASTKGRVISPAQRTKISEALKGRKMSATAVANMKIAAKRRGISEKTREAQRKAVTGRPRAPFSAQTIERMRAAATLREAQKRMEVA